MRLTPALYVRDLLAKFHPPLPTTARESQQFLRVLEGSFRKHLDDKHPPPGQRQPFNISQSEIPLTSLTSSADATLQHLTTILSNPLLARRDGQEKPNITVAANALQVFARAMLEGNVTLPLLHQCLKNYLYGFKQGDKLDERERMAARLASWLYTVDPASKEAFLGSAEVLDLAVQVTGVDRQEAVAWDWLRMIYERDFGSTSVETRPVLSDPKWLSIEDRLVSYIMRLSVRRGELNDAAQQFVEACQYRLDSGRAAVRPNELTHGTKYVPLGHSWKRLAAAITFHRAKHGISAPMFDRAVSYSIPWGSEPLFSSPVLMVHHPTSPSAKSLYQHLKDPILAEQFLSMPARFAKKFRRIMLLNVLDGAQLSLDQGFREQARFLLNFAKVHYSEFLPALTEETTPDLDAQIRTAQISLRSQSYNLAWT